MKLIACHLNNFGKLSDLSINFNEGVNVINQPNGLGKSTLAAFLKAMLYGFDTDVYKRQEGTSEELRDKIKGQVFCICVDENKADLIRRNYLISNMKREKDKVIRCV